MKDIEIPPAAQIAVLAAFMAALAAIVAAQLPEIRRYMRVRSM